MCQPGQPTDAAKSQQKSLAQKLSQYYLCFQQQ